MRARGLAREHAVLLGLELGQLRGQPIALRQEFLIAQFQQRLAGSHSGAVFGEQADHEAIGFRTDARIVRQPDEAVGDDAQRQGYGEYESSQRQRGDHGDASAAARLARAIAFPQKPAKEMGARQDEEGPGHGSPDHAREHRGNAAQPDNDGGQDDKAVDEGCRSVAQQPDPLSTRRNGATLGAAEKIPLDEIRPLAGAALRQVGQIERVDEDEVAVVAHQGIAVEEQRRHGADEHDGHRHVADPAMFDRQPKEHGKRREEEFRHDAGRTDDEALMGKAEACRCRRIHPGDG